jgi:polyisoprenoid-binding protein YceI
VKRNHIKYEFGLAVTLLALAGAAQSRAQKVSVHLEPAQSEIHWTLGDLTHTVKGEFKFKGGLLTFDPKTGVAEGELLVDVDSGDSGSHMRDQKMKKDVLESEKYPQAFFHPTRITGFTSAAAQEIIAEGTFNIHGTDHPLTLKIQLQLAAASATARTQFVIPYVAWGMKDPSVLMLRVAKEVRVDVVARGSVKGLAGAAPQESRQGSLHTPEALPRQ